MTKRRIVGTVRAHFPDVQALYLFGSYGTPDERPDSDADIAVLLPFETAKARGDIGFSPCREALEKLLSKPVDLINLRKADTVFQNEILNTARLIYSDGNEAAVLFESSVLSLYQKLNEERKEILVEFSTTKRAYEV